MSTLLERMRNPQAAGAAPRPADADRPTLPSYPCGVFWDTPTAAGIVIITGAYGRARLAIFPSKPEPGREANPKAPQFYSKLSQQVTEEQRQKKEFGPEIYWNSFWLNTADDGTEYLNTTLFPATERDGGELFQLWPIRNPGPKGPHWQGRKVFTPKLAPGEGRPAGPRGTAQAPTEEPAGAESQGDEIPF
jgi:hypothetical protein